jgi:hypothetical protein
VVTFPSTASRVALTYERRALPIVGKRGAIGAGAAAGIANVFIDRSQHLGTLTVMLSSLFMGVFTFAGVRLISCIRANIRPDTETPQERDPSSAPPLGGWANPTRAQSKYARWRRIFSRH